MTSHLTEDQAREMSARNREARRVQFTPRLPDDRGLPPPTVYPPMPPVQRIRSPRPAAPTEHAECLHFIEWTKLVRYRGAALFDRVVKIPNERGKPGASIALLQQIGMRNGFPDYDVLAPAGRWHGLYLEAKRLTGGRIEPEQEKWRMDLIGWGYHAAICAGALELIAATRWYFVSAGCVADGSWVDNTRVEK